VSDDVAQQDIDNIVIDRDGFAKAWHFERMKEGGRRMKRILLPLYQ